MLKQATCQICGKEFSYEAHGGRPRKFCSKQCSDKAGNQSFRESHKDYWKERYANDEDFAKKKREYNVAFAKRKRNTRKEEALRAIVDEIRSAKTPDEAVAIFEAKARVRSELYS